MSRFQSILVAIVGFMLGITLRDVLANPGLLDGALKDGAPKDEVRSYDRGVEQVLRGIKSGVKDARYSIKVTDLEDFVLLEGEVDSERSRDEVVGAAKAATSKRIRDELRIASKPSDEQIAEHLREALRRDHPQFGDRIKVDVRNGVAYLSGDLGNHREVDELLATALMVEGVVDIKSDIIFGRRGRVSR